MKCVTKTHVLGACHRASLITRLGAELTRYQELEPDGSPRLESAGRQELENPHGPLTTGTAPDRRFSCVRHVRWRRSRQQSSTEGQEHTTTPIREKAEVTDARE